MCLNLHLYETGRCLGLLRGSRARISLNAVALTSGFFGLLTVRVFVNLFLAKSFGVRMQLREHSLQLIDVDVQDSLEELAANFLESTLQLRHNTPPLDRSPDDQEPVIAGIAPASQETALLESVNEARYLPLVSAHDLCKLYAGSLPFFRTMHQDSCFLGRHPVLAETTIECCLQPYAGTEEPRYGQFRLPASNARVLPLRPLPFSERILQKSPLLPGLDSLRHPFGCHNFAR